VIPILPGMIAAVRVLRRKNPSGFSRFSLGSEGRVFVVPWVNQRGGSGAISALGSTTRKKKSFIDFIGLLSTPIYFIFS